MLEVWIKDVKTALGPLLDPSNLIGALFYAVIIFSLGALASWLLGVLIHRWEKQFRRLFSGVEETVWRFILHLKSLIVFLVALVVYASLIPGLKGILTTLAAGAGLTAVIIGFAAKSTVSNLISGLALAIFRPIRIGDTVTIENEYGIIEDITIRHTVLRSWENKRIVIPNEKLDNTTIVNYSLNDPRMLLRLEFGVSYDTDIDLARRVILDEVMKCPHRLEGTQALSEPKVRVVEHADSAIKLRAYMWTANVDETWYGRFWLLEQVKKRFDKENIEIPFPYRTVVYKNELPPARREEKDQLDSLPGSDPAAQSEKALMVLPQPEATPENKKSRKAGFMKMWGFLKGKKAKTASPKASNEQPPGSKEQENK